MYDLDRSSGKWTSTVLDTKIAAQDCAEAISAGDDADVVAIAYHA